MSILQPVLPGAVLGVVGGGQLGRYFVLAARQLGYDTWVLDPDATAPAMQVAAHPLVAAYDDVDALDALAEACDAVTIEFENVPSGSLDRLAAKTRVAPSSSSVRLAQDRALEKAAAAAAGLRPVPFAVLEQESDIESALAAVSLPAILKTSRLGYDGKGQQLCRTPADVRTGWSDCGGVACVLEARVDLAAELSVVLARGFDGNSTVFPVASNVHVNGILHLSSVPAEIAPSLCDEAQRLAIELADALDHQGILAVEFFVDEAGTLYFNEMAPRPHNSGHYSLDATSVSQFEAQLRVLCALPLPTPVLRRPVTMLNLLGECWEPDDPDWASVLAIPDAHLHNYGKSMARPGRKMGHVNVLGDGVHDTVQVASRLHERLRGSSADTS